MLAGGAARRLGGVLKPALPLGGRPLVTRVLDAAAAASLRVVVGPPALASLLPAGVRLVQERPPGGGPVAGLAAGVRLVPPGVRRVAVLSADLPFLTPAVLAELEAALADGGDVAVLLDDSDRPQWLCSMWRREALDTRLAAWPDARGVRVRDLVGELTVHRVAVDGLGPPPWFDCDTEEDVRRAEEMLHDSR